MGRLLPETGPRVIVHLGDFGIWPGPGGQEYLARIGSALADAAAELWFVDGNHEDFSQLGLLRPGPDRRGNGGSWAVHARTSPSSACSARVRPAGSRSPNGSGPCPAAPGGAGVSGT